MSIFIEARQGAFVHMMEQSQREVRVGKGWDWFGRTADVVTIVAAVISAAALFVTGSAQQVVMALALSALAIAATIVAWGQSHQLYNAAEAGLQSHMLVFALGPFSEAMTELKRGYSALLLYLEEDFEFANARTQLVSRFEAACNNTTAAFQAMAGHDCRVTLQELYTIDQPDDQVRAAVRTVATSDRGAATGPESVDWVDENTDFASLVAGAEVFHSADLRESLQQGYRNSHWTPERLHQWHLDGDYPYLSTIVWPIRVRIDGSQKWKMAGFLSVDSKQPDVFDLPALKPLGAALASAAYMGLSLYGAVKNSADVRETEGSK